MDHVDEVAEGERAAERAVGAGLQRGLGDEIGFRLAAVGPLEVHDFGGLDIQTTVFRNLAPEIRSNTELPKIVERIVSQGHYGFKNGQGFYDYPADKADAARVERDQRYLALLKLFHSRQPTATTERLDPQE